MIAWSVGEVKRYSSNTSISEAGLCPITSNIVSETTSKRFLFFIGKQPVHIGEEQPGDLLFR